MSTRRTCDMTTGASGALAVPNIRDWGCEPAGGPDEDASTWDIRIDFYMAGLAVPRTFAVTVSNSTSTKLSRNGAPTGIDDLIVRSSVATPAGFTAAVNGWRGGATKAARQKGLADALIAAGIIDATLGGTTS